jgi:choline-sulfatase
MSDYSRRHLLGALGAAAVPPPLPPPNILFLCSDQHTSTAMGANGHPIVKTPNLDRLAAAGTNFASAYCGNPVCVPSRASLMTGVFASDVESYCNSTPFDGRIPTWGKRLQNAGYHTWATGKLDICDGKDIGFEQNGTSHGHWSDPDITSLFRAPVCYRPKERNNANGTFRDREAPDQPKVRKAIQFLKEESRRSGKPWAAYVGLSKPHPKFEAASRFHEIYPPDKMPLPRWPEGYLENRHAMFQVLANFKNVQVPVPGERVRRARAAYYGLITELDELIGSILAALDSTGQRENTIVVYTSDHGEMLGEHGLWLKNVLLEPAARVPLIIAGLGVPAGRRVEGPVAQTDLIATLMRAAGASTEGLRGHALFDGSHPGFAYAESHSEGNCTGSFLIREGDWKYLYFTGDEPLLFNLKDDPGEFYNLADDRRYADVRQKLHARLTSLVDPDAVTYAAFRKQEAVLSGLVRTNSREEFYKRLVGRMGTAQARVLTEREYRRRA